MHFYNLEWWNIYSTTVPTSITTKPTSMTNAIISTTTGKLMKSEQTAISTVETTSPSILVTSTKNAGKRQFSCLKRTY